MGAKPTMTTSTSGDRSFPAHPDCNCIFAYNGIFALDLRTFREHAHCAAVWGRAMSPGPYFSAEPDPDTVGYFGGYRSPTLPPQGDPPQPQAQPLPMPPTPRPLLPQDDLSVSPNDLTPEQRRARYEAYLQHPNAQRFLSTIANTEGATYDSLNNYVKGSKKFTDYSQFPLNGPGATASGRYQILKGTYGDASQALGLDDFSPHTQDLMAMYLIDQKGALEPLLRGDLDAVLPRVAPVWNSLPKGKGLGNYRPGQPYTSYDDVKSIFDLYRSP